MATATMQALESSHPQGIQTKFTVELPEALAVSLQEWFERSGDVGDINNFFAQVCELPIIDFRAGDLPPSEEEHRSLSKEKMNAARKEELFEVFDDGEECNTTVLAMRFGISPTTVRRLLKQREDAMGIVAKTKTKHPLRPEQIQEIVRLKHLGVSVHEIAKRFHRTTASIYQIGRPTKSEAA